MTRDKYDALFDEPEDIRSLMGASDLLGLTGMEWNEGGFIETRHIVVTEPWRASLVRLGERPRVGQASKSISCSYCAKVFMGRGRARFCSESCKQRAKRAR